MNVRCGDRSTCFRVMTACVIVTSVVASASAQDSRLPLAGSLLESLFSGQLLEPREAGARIDTERHDFTQSTTTVGRHVLQFESGYTFFHRSEEDEASHATPELFMRYGLMENLEFRLRYNHAWQFADDDRNGAEDMGVSFKFRTTDQACRIPESALEVRFTVPTGSREWSTGDVEFGLDYIYGWRLSEVAEIYGSTGFSTNALAEFAFATLMPDGENFMLYTQSVALGLEVTERVAMYTEVFGLFTDGFEDDEEAPVFFNIGIDYYVTDDIVLDVRVGTGLNNDAEDLFAGIGGGIRF